VDNQTHDVYVELEPQGRLLLSITMDGEQEDVDFWFKRTNERLIRVRDHFLRSLTANVFLFKIRLLLMPKKSLQIILKIMKLSRYQHKVFSRQ
jgi:hypothetical protein